jgi:dipeptidyl aminopeptidase/acylaminoacyl peptidase
MKNIAVLALVVAATAAAAPPLTPEQALNRRAISDLEFSPDGAHVVFTVTDPPKGTTRPRHLWLLDVANTHVRPLTTAEGKADSSPRWSPDGRFVAFLSNREADRGETDRDTAQHLYLLPMAGGEAERFVDAKESVTAIRWSPDGRQIAFLMPEQKPPAVERREKDRDDARRLDKEERHPRIWVVDVASRSVRQVTRGAWRIRQIEWTPNGDELVALATDRPESDRWTERIFAVSLADGQFTPTAAPRGPIDSFTVAEDGTVAYIGARVDGPEPHDLWIVTRDGASTNLTGSARTDAAFDRPLRQPRWIDRSTVWAIADSGFHSRVVSVSVNGHTQTVAGGDNVVNAFARPRTGTPDVVAYVSETTTQAPELWLKAPNADAVKVTAFNEQWTSIPLTAPEIVQYKSVDGVTIEGALLVPNAAARLAGGRFPFVVLVHGGPTGRWSEVFEPWGQLLASRGYAVLYPNIRGSTGYGQRFVEMNRGDWGGGDFKDVMAGVDWAVARGVADPDRLAIGGWSYGGYMAAWAVTQTNRFKAAVSGAPVIDLASEYGTEQGAAYDEWFYGVPYEALDGFIKSSPITYVKRVKTPTLLLQGEDDTTDPIGQSQQFYRGLKRYGVESELVLYPREGHGLREEKHLIDRLNRVVAWFDKYLKAAMPTTQP